MTEDVEIKISSEIDTKGLDQLRKQLNDSRNEMNAMSRQLDKTSTDYKNLKASVAEVNRIIKLSDADLKAYTQSLIVQDKQIQQVTRSKGTMLTSTEKLGRSFTMLKTNVGQYSSTLVNLTGDIASGDKTIMQSVGTLGLYAGGWAAVASAIFLATSNLVDYLNTNTEEIKTFEKKTDKVFGADVLGGRDASLDYLNKKTEGGMFFSPEEIAKTEKELRTLKEIEAEKSKISTPRNNASLQKTAKIIVEKTQQELYIEMLKRANESLGFSKSQRINDRTLTLLQQMNLPGGNFSQAAPQTPGISTSRDTLEDIQTGYSLIAQSMSLLNIGTDTFVGKLMTVFGFVNSALSIGSSIIKFVTSIIPGVPDSMVSGGNTSIDTNRLINQNISMSSSPVNIYMSSNVSQKYFKAQIESYNSMKQYTKI